MRARARPRIARSGRVTCVARRAGHACTRRRRIAAHVDGRIGSRVVRGSGVAAGVWSDRAIGAGLAFGGGGAASESREHERDRSEAIHIRPAYRRPSVVAALPFAGRS
jgi:hypothetical protein